MPLGVNLPGGLVPPLSLPTNGAMNGLNSKDLLPVGVSPSSLPRTVESLQDNFSTHLSNSGTLGEMNPITSLANISQSSDNNHNIKLESSIITQNSNNAFVSGMPPMDNSSLKFENSYMVGDNDLLKPSSGVPGQQLSSENHLIPSEIPHELIVDQSNSNNPHQLQQINTLPNAQTSLSINTMATTTSNPIEMMSLGQPQLSAQQSLPLSGSAASNTINGLESMSHPGIMGSTDQPNLLSMATKPVVAPISNNNSFSDPTIVPNMKMTPPGVDNLQNNTNKKIQSTQQQLQQQQQPTTSNSNTNPQNSRKRNQNQSSGYESISATSSEYSPPNDKKQKILNYSHNAGNSHNHNNNSHFGNSAYKY